jgi:tRNA threonylcarbamoyladenosine biosynthesis protein TsaE
MASETWIYEAKDEAATERLGAGLAKSLPRPSVVALRGTLGAGKTRLVRAMAGGLGMDPSLVTSPTFVLVHEYPGETPVYHFDAYRLRGEDEFWQLGPDEYFNGEGGGITVLEWADRVAGCLPNERMEITIDVVGTTERRFAIVALGEKYELALSQLKQLIEPNSGN